MLPPGIFIWESESKRPESQSLAALHQRWKADVDALGPWQESVHIDGVGGFWRSDAENQTTVVVTESCSSTMEQARVLAEQGVLGEWGALVAGVQLSGRGQLRRPWVSSAGNLHVSVVMPASPKTGEWRTALDSLLSLFAGYIFSVVLTQLGTNIQLKWPNDLLQDGKKVGGLLIEEKNGIVILGLGINLVECPSDEAMREDRSAQAGVLETSDNCGGPLSLWCTLVNRGKSVYSVLLDELEPPQFISLAEKQLAWVGRKVLVREGNENSYHAEILGLSPDGGLLLRRGSQEAVLYSGSIFPL